MAKAPPKKTAAPKSAAPKSATTTKTAAADPVPTNGVVVGKSTKYEVLDYRFGNRHGLVTGATGTGKTVTLQVMAEGFAAAGVPIFAADIKGDLSGISAAGEAKPAFVDRCKGMGLDYQPDQFTAVFWDVFGAEGHPIRATISEMGPLLLSRLLQLNDTQEGVLNIAFRVADEQGLALLDLKDIRAMLGFISDNATELQKEYGNVSPATVGTIQRALLVLENQGATSFFGEPALDIKDFMRTDRDGRGIVNILSADKLIANPRLYATFLLWMLSELFEQLPEVGDLDKPKLVFFFDEAHLLFNDAPKALLEKIEQVVRLIRSKGVGVYFVTQNPLDVPETVLAQLGNRVQHALRAYTPREQKAVKTAADTFRPNPAFSTADAITQLGVGEALVSTLEDKGVPSMVQRTLIRPPGSRIGPLTVEERRRLVATSPIGTLYDKPVDRESAFEILSRTVEEKLPANGSAPRSGEADLPQTGESGIAGTLGTIFGTNRPRGTRLTAGQRVAREVTRTVTNRVAGEFAASVGRQLGGRMGGSIGRSIIRGMLGGILRGR
jgi:DNA helicase HerA-like ATPase